MPVVALRRMCLKSTPCRKTGVACRPRPWRYFGSAGIISMMPEGYEKNAPKLRDLQDAATAKMVRDLAHQVLTPAARAPTLIDHVLLFDADAGQFLPDRAVLVQNGKIAAVGAGGSLKAPAASLNFAASAQ